MGFIMKQEPDINDVFELVDTKGLGMERPEYVLKNGKAFNVYAALKYIQAQQERIKGLELDLGLVKISLDHKTTLLNSCEIALEREQFPPK